MSKTGIKGNTTFMLTLAALFAAVLCAASWISLPLPLTPIPANLATLAVTLAGALLGHKYGTFSVLVYILLGAVGVPVFAGFTGGLGHIAGPTGGYIAGYLTSAFICGLIVQLFYDRIKNKPDPEEHVVSDDQAASADPYSEKAKHKKSSRWWVITIAAFLGTASCYAIGTIWFMILTGNSLAASLALCVAPFLPGDVFKIAAATVLVPLLKTALARFI